MRGFAGARCRREQGRSLRSLRVAPRTPSWVTYRRRSWPSHLMLFFLNKRSRRAEKPHTLVACKNIHTAAYSARMPLAWKGLLPGTWQPIPPGQRKVGLDVGCPVQSQTLVIHSWPNRCVQKQPRPGVTGIGLYNNGVLTTTLYNNGVLNELIMSA